MAICQWIIILWSQHNVTTCWNISLQAIKRKPRIKRKELNRLLTYTLNRIKHNLKVWQWESHEMEITNFTVFHRPKSCTSLAAQKKMLWRWIVWCIDTLTWTWWKRKRAIASTSTWSSSMQTVGPYYTTLLFVLEVGQSQWKEVDCLVLYF